MPRQATEVEKAYLAGLIDGEGCIGAAGLRDKRPGRGEGVMFTVFVSMCDRACIDLCLEIYGGSIRERRPSNPKHRQVFTWQAYGDLGARILRDVRPYLRLKGTQADAYLLARTTFTGGPRKGLMGSQQPSDLNKEIRRACLSTIHLLNVRGRHADEIRIAA